MYLDLRKSWSERPVVVKCRAWFWSSLLLLRLGVLFLLLLFKILTRRRLLISEGHSVRNNQAK